MTWARIGTFEVEPSNADKLVGFFRDEVTPLFAKNPGFLGYQAFMDRESGRYIGISYWDTKAHLEGSAQSAKFALEKAASLGALVIGSPTTAHSSAREGSKLPAVAGR